MIQHDFKCDICGKVTYLFQDDRDLKREHISYPMSEKWEEEHGCVNVAIKMDCGHWMLDDKDHGTPDYVSELK